MQNWESALKPTSESELRPTFGSEVRVHISAVTKCVTNFLTLSQLGLFDSVKNFVTHFVTLEIWTLRRRTPF